MVDLKYGLNYIIDLLATYNDVRVKPSPSTSVITVFSVLEITSLSSTTFNFQNDFKSDFFPCIKRKKNLKRKENLCVVTWQMD